MNKIKITLLTMMLAAVANADQTAVTQDGREVLLKDNGTWVYVHKQRTTTPAFRKASWGMSKSEIKKLETAPLINEDDEMLMYRGELSTSRPLDAIIVYIFVADKLVRGVYLITERHTNKNDHIADYTALKALLTKKYGKPTVDRQIWADTLYQNTPENWGLAVVTGSLVYGAIWHAQGTTISILLRGDNFKVDHQIQYQSDAFHGLEVKKDSQKVLGNL